MTSSTKKKSKYALDGIEKDWPLALLVLMLFVSIGLTMVLGNFCFLFLIVPFFIFVMTRPRFKDMDRTMEWKGRLIFWFLFWLVIGAISVSAVLLIFFMFDLVF